MFKTQNLIRDLKGAGLKVDKVMTRDDKNPLYIGEDYDDGFNKPKFEYSYWEVRLANDEVAANILKYDIFDDPKIVVYVTEQTAIISSLAHKRDIKWYLDTKAEMIADSIIENLL